MNGLVFLSISPSRLLKNANKLNRNLLGLMSINASINARKLRHKLNHCIESKPLFLNVHGVDTKLLLIYFIYKQIAFATLRFIISPLKIPLYIETPVIN